MVIHVSAKSDIGVYRAKNEDSFYVDAENGLFIICDGMGGHLAGEVASQKTIEFATTFLNIAKAQRILPQKADVDFREVWRQLIVETIEHCCVSLVSFAKRNPQLDGMATTLTLVQVVEGVAFVGHVGDSRLYLKNGELAKQLTCDHTLFEEFARANPNWINTNCDPEALYRFKHILTRCVGRERDFKVDAFCFQLAGDDVLLLCTDGLSNYFENEAAVVEFLNDEDSDHVVDSLIEFANSNGGLDNITAIVIRILSLDDSEVGEFALRPDQLIFDTDITQEWN